MRFFLGAAVVLFCNSFLPYAQALALDSGVDERRAERRDPALTEELLSKFRLFANYTAASYCPSNENATSGTPITCPVGVCSMVEDSDAISVVEFGVDATTTTAIKGFVSTSSSLSLIIVAFAGSGKTIRNWITDFEFATVSSTLCTGCEIHSGFSTSWSERHDLVTSAVFSALAANPDYSIVVTGHSIGAAVATLATAELRSLGYIVDLYTYGSPRVGNEAFAEFVTDQAPSFGENYRVTHVNDPVPQIPPELIGYEHLSPEYWLSTGNATTDVYGVEDVVICVGIGNADCNAGTGLIPIEGTAHGHYFGLIDACEGPVEWRRDAHR